MRKIFSLLIIGILWLSTFSILGPKVKAINQATHEREGSLVLTFDTESDSADPSSGFVSELTLETIGNIGALLQQNNIQATFFAQGAAFDNPVSGELFEHHIQDLHSMGHEIGAHSYSHPDGFGSLSPENMLSELVNTEENIINAVGILPKGFRAPHFSYSQALWNMLAQRGYSYESSVWIGDVGKQDCKPYRITTTNGILYEVPWKTYDIWYPENGWAYHDMFTQWQGWITNEIVQNGRTIVFVFHPQTVADYWSLSGTDFQDFIQLITDLEQSGQLQILTAYDLSVSASESILFAGGSNPGVVYKYACGTEWEVISPELGYAVLSLVEYEGHLYAGTTSEYGGSNGVGQVYRYDGGTTWTLVGDSMDHDVCSLVVYQDNLYAGTAWSGMKLYRYEGGATWTQVIDSIVWDGTRSLYISHDYLLMGDVHYDYIGHWDGTMFYQDQPSGTGSCIYDFQDYSDYVYAAAYVGRLWRSPDAINWDIVLDPYDGNMWELEEFQDKLFMSYNNGDLRAYDGTGDLRGELIYSALDGIISMTTDEDYLYFGTGGDAVGWGPESSGIASVYKYDGTSAVPISEQDEMVTGVQVLYVSRELPDLIPPIVSNVRHEPLYPTSTDEIFFYADVTDNVAVSIVQLNYTEDGGATWLLKDMTLLEEITYTTSLGPYSTRTIIGFYVIAYDEAGNKGIGSEIVPPIPEPPRVAPVLISDEYPVPLPEGYDVWYIPEDTGTNIYVDVDELGLYLPGLLYYIYYSIDGGLTWIRAELTQISDYVWKYIIPAITNILFRIETSDGRSSIIYWIIIAPWKYPIYLYFSENEKYYPVKGFYFDGDSNIANNRESYEEQPTTYWKQQIEENDIDIDEIRDLWSYSYMNPKRLDDSCLVIEYWVYYAFNEFYVPLLPEPLLPDLHEHDLESIFLWIDVATGNIKKIALNQHIWANNYEFASPPSRLNVAVEEGGHGMILLKSDPSGMPLVGTDGYYEILKPDNCEIYYPGKPDGRAAGWFKGKFGPQSFWAQLHPWKIYDPRIPLSQLEGFGDSSILTTGLSSLSIFPSLVYNPSGTIDLPYIYSFYNHLRDLSGKSTLLQTSYGINLPIDETTISFMIDAPWYRVEFQNPSRQWNKLSFEFWYVVEKTAHIAMIIINLIRLYLGDFTSIIGIVTNCYAIYFDPICGSVIDSSGRILGYRGIELAEEIPGGLIFFEGDFYELYFIINATDEYTFQMFGADASNYNFALFNDLEEGQINFNAIDIPVVLGSVHQYAFDWELLGIGGYGATIWIDQDGDGTFERRFTSDSELTAEEFQILIGDTVAPNTDLIIGEPKFFDSSGNIYVTSDTPLTLDAIDDSDTGSGVALTGYRYDGGWIEDVPPLRFYIEGLDGPYLVEYNSTDNAGNVESTNIQPVILDNTAPVITDTNFEGLALQDGVTFEVSAWDLSDVATLTFSIQCMQGDIIPQFESMPATHSPECKWKLDFDTTLLPDGFYSATMNATDVLGNWGTTPVPFSIRNWACLELLPASESNKAGRTMPVKFSLRVVEAVDPTQPFVYNEELTIRIYEKSHPGNILQESTLGDTSRDYRIDLESEHYITNFRTIRKKPKTYVVEIWRKDMLVGSFEFSTVK